MGQNHMLHFHILSHIENCIKVNVGGFQNQQISLLQMRFNISDFVDVTKGQSGVRMGEKGIRTIQGLALPMEVLEKIYFRNAMRIYPHVKENLKALGYPVK